MSTINKILFAAAGASVAQPYMHLRFDTTKETDTSNTVKFALTAPTGEFITVDWGDGFTNTYESFSPLFSIRPQHNYSVDGVYDVKIYGNQSSFETGFSATPKKLIEVVKFNENLTSLAGAFADCINLTTVPLEVPPSVTNMYLMFSNASAFNQNIGSWDVSNVTNMENMFSSGAFNNGGSPSIGSWNTGAVTNMARMFIKNTAFNQNIGSWDVSNVTDMTSMFEAASAFNQNLSTWITGLTSQPSSFSIFANATFANNTNNLKPFLAGGVTRINT